MNKKRYYKKILSYFLKHKKKIIIFVITSIATLIINTFTPLLSAKLITAITNVELKQMIFMALILFLFSAIGELVRMINNEVSSRLQDLVELDIKSDVSKELFKLEVKNFDDEGTGFFYSRINSAPSSIASIFSRIRYNLISLLSSIGVFIYVFIINYKIGLGLLCLSIIMFILQRKRSKVWEQTTKEVNELNEKYTSNFGEIIKGIRDIKVLNLKDIMIKKTTNDQSLLTETEHKIRIKERKFDAIYWIIDAVAELSLILFGVYLIKNGELSGANFLVIYMYKYTFNAFIYSINSLYDEYKKINVSIERLYEVIDGVKYPLEKFGTTTIDKIDGEITFQNVNFGYNETQVLKDINFQIKPNETVGFVGKSGQGKTTIFNLISKLYTINDGMILIDGININDLTENSIRKNISVITQNPYIFNLTIKENLKLANPNISDEELIEKCKLCALHDFIETLEKKYDSKVGENGVMLSGGQKQRLAIARALIKDSEIILLDEATSALDNETQDYIQESIRKISANFTILIIAHRLSTVVNCDKIIVMDEGRVIDIGKHEELIKRCEPYKKIYKKELV